MTSWAERKKKLQDKTRHSAENREGQSSSVLSYKELDGREIFWADKPKSGRNENLYDFIPFVVSEEYYRDMRTFAGKPTGLSPGDVDYKLEYAVHKLPTGESMVCINKCFGQPCGICEERERLFDEGDEKLAEALKPKWRCLYNIIDLNSDEEIRLWDNSYYLFEKGVLTEVQLGSDGLDIFWDIEEGKTVRWRGEKKKFGKFDFIQADRIDFDKREPYPDEIVDEAYPLDKMLIIPTYEQTVRLITGMPTETNESEEKPFRNTRSRNSDKNQTKERSKNRRSRFEEKEEDVPHFEDENKCTEGREFGADFNQHPECQNCPDDIYNKCQIESEEIKKKKSEEKEEPEKRNTRRRRR